MNKLIEAFVRRPVLTSALSIFILLLGSFGLIKMPLRFLPKIDQALIEILTVYPGANSTVVKNFVTSKIQNSIVGVEGIDYVTSSSTTGYSDIKAYLSPGINADKALMVIMGKVSSVTNELPSSVQTPMVIKNNVDSRPTIIFAFASTGIPRAEISDYLTRVIAPQLETVDGVAQANVWSSPYSMQIWLNPDALAAYHLSPQDVVAALKTQNVLAAPGKTQGKYVDYTLNTTTALHTPEQFNHLVIKVVNHVPIYLQDIGVAKMGAEQDTYMVYYQGIPCTMIGVSLLPTANPLVVVDALKKKMDVIKHHLPSGLTANLVYDQTTFIRASLHEVIKTLIESIVIVILVILLFLGNVRAALIPAITIPVSLLGVCFFMQMLGYSINTITLLAMVLAVGLVVDDAIVVVENSVRHLSDKLSTLTTTIHAAQELALPVIAMTITLAAVYVPIGFSGGLVGELFTEFAFTLAGSVIISGVIALTLSPMMSARFLTLQQQHQPLAIFAEKIMQRLQQKYKTILVFLMNYKMWLVIAWLSIMILSVLLYKMIPSELAPTENHGYIMVAGDAPANVNRNYLMHYALATHKIYSHLQNVDHFATVVSPDDGYFAYLIGDQKPGEKTSLLGSIQTIQQQLNQVPGIDFHVLAPSTLPGSGAGVQFVLQSSKDYKTLYHAAKMLEQKAMQSGLFLFLYDDLNYNNPQATIDINPLAAASANVSMSNIAEALSSLLSNQEVQPVSVHDQSYNVVIKTLPSYQLNPEDLQNIAIPTGNNTTVPLSTVATLHYSVVPQALNQFQKMNSVTIMGGIKPGYTLSQGLNVLNNVAAAKLSNDVTVDYSGTSREFKQEGNRMIFIFVLAIVVIFLVLSMQFESYRDSLIILLGSVPMGLFAALLSLKIGQGTINIYTQIGLLTLVGLISKHGILITRFANELKLEKNLTKQEAVIEAALLRFRPILMTTAAILFGALPLIHAVGSGAESRHAIGLVVAVGIGLGTLLTLLLLPIVYWVFSKEMKSNTNAEEIN
ncbi:MAG: efflux RND transporter permease subunit [Legionellales bacterium]|nr:efflux RND transporter permease subunit [Legionellales bacterium]